MAITADWCVAACSEKLDLTEINQNYCKTFALSQIPGNNLLTAGALRGTARTINASSQIEPGVSWRFPESMRATPGTITLYSPAASGATNGNSGPTMVTAVTVLMPEPYSRILRV